MTRSTTDTDRKHQRPRRGLVWLVLLASVVWAAVAHAEAGPQERATAEALFQDGKRLMGIGKTAEACRKLEESQRLDPRAGTLLALAVCHQKEGRIATAWVEFREALALAKKAGRPDRVALAQKEISAIEPKLPRLAIVVPKESALPGLVLKRDGEEFGRPSWDTAVPVDPGEHDVVASAPDRKSWQVKVSIHEGEEKKVTVPVLELEAKPVASAPPPPPPPAKKPKTLAWVAGGIGVAALGVGTYFGLRAMSKRSSSDDHCHGALCDPQGVELNNQAKSAAVVSNVAFGVGLVGIGVATWLLLTGDSDRRAAGSAQRIHVTAVTGPREAAILIHAPW
ncbi:MAG: hypothetical protein HY898_29765 [Deltaproteobacteria bacterium]|nr:hypothetical protein [Deltaproteobacteria bacterium]